MTYLSSRILLNVPVPVPVPTSLNVLSGTRYSMSQLPKKKSNFSIGSSRFVIDSPIGTMTVGQAPPYLFDVTPAKAGIQEHNGSI